MRIVLSFITPLHNPHILPQSLRPLCLPPLSSTGDVTSPSASISDPSISITPPLYATPTPRLDYDETFALIAHMTTVRNVIVVAASCACTLLDGCYECFSPW
jgi:hypothetical protein